MKEGAWRWWRRHAHEYTPAAVEEEGEEGEVWEVGWWRWRLCGNTLRDEDDQLTPRVYCFLALLWTIRDTDTATNAHEHKNVRTCTHTEAADADENGDNHQAPTGK